MNNNDMFSQYKDIVTVDEVMEMLRLGKNSIYNLLKDGKIESFRVGTRYVIPKKNVIKFINEQI